MSSRLLWGLLLGFVGGTAWAGSPANQSASPAASAAEGKVLLTMDEALRLAFPKAQVQRTTAYLSGDQQKAIQKACGSAFSDRVVYPYVATRDGKVVGTAYFDTHRVRSLRQTLMVVVGADGKIARVELLAFAEPRKYQPQPKWLQQFCGAGLDRDLRLGGRVRPMSGATLTAKATLECSRRLLALHAELSKSAPKPEKPKPDKPKPERPSPDPQDPPTQKPAEQPPSPQPKEAPPKREPAPKEQPEEPAPKPVPKPPSRGSTP